jgi:hypothetical protein
MAKQDYYEILGVSKTAEEREIKKAYKRLAMKYHPDRNQGDKEAEAKFKEIKEAYEILTDARSVRPTISTATRPLNRAAWAAAAAVWRRCRFQRYLWRCVSAISLAAVVVVSVRRAAPTCATTWS